MQEILNHKMDFKIVKYKIMGRNNERNIKKHNDKLHKAQDKVKQAEIVRKEKLKQIVKKFNENNTPDSNKI